MVSSITNSNTTTHYVIRFKLWLPHITQHANNLKHHGYYFGISRGTFKHKEGLTSYKSIKRWYRSQGYVANPEFLYFKQNLPQIKWHKTSRLLYHMRLTPECRLKIWQMITGKLYMGIVAFNYLERTKKFPQYRDNYKYCPHCVGYTHSTYAHQFWECPHSKKLWGVLKTYLKDLDIQMPINTFLT